MTAQPTRKLVQRMRRHARLLRRVSREEGSWPAGASSGALLASIDRRVLAAIANVQDQAADQLEAFMRAHGGDVASQAEDHTS